MRIISHYRDIDTLRASFIHLAHDIFGLDFSSWYEKGYWGDRYVPYSYADGEKIAANASVNKLDFIIGGQHCRALQIGTVMTHPDYRGKGLAASLMNHILEEYKDQYDIMYLFANDTVLDFYPRFGFERVEEFLYSVKAASLTTDTLLQKLDISSPNDLQLLEKMIFERMPVSKAFATANSGCITMYHILNVFTDHLYYSAEDDAVFIFSKDDVTVQLFDVISMAPISIERIVASIADEAANEIVFHYTPDYKGFEYKKIPYRRDGALFVKTNGSLEFPHHVKHPVTSEA
jgi:GNAT superfamily N-acetyltransferase